MGNIKIIRGVFDTKPELEHAGIKAGFPSPAEDYIHEALGFNRDYTTFRRVMSPCQRRRSEV